jgi:hypothetical protein
MPRRSVARQRRQKGNRHHRSFWPSKETEVPLLALGFKTNLLGGKAMDPDGAAIFLTLFHAKWTHFSGMFGAAGGRENSQKAQKMEPKGKRKRGRPLKATPQLIQAVLDDLARGLNREWACAMNGCSHDQWQEWEKRPEFAGLRARAIGTRVKYLVSRLEVEENPAISKSLQWLLERTKSYDNQFAAPVQMPFGVQNNTFMISVEKAREIEETRAKLLPRVNERFLTLVNREGTNGTETAS